MEKRPVLKTIQFIRWIPVVLIFITLVLSIGKASAEERLILVAANSAPTAYFEEGQLKGILVDVVTEAFSRTGYPITIELKPWARCLIEVREGTVDGIFSAYRLPEREEYLFYTDSPIITQIQALFVRVDSSIAFDGDLANLSDTEIGIIRDTSYGEKIDEMINNKTWKNVSKAESVESLVAMLVSERFDLSPSYRHVFLDAANRIGAADKIKELTPSVDEIPSYLAFSKKKDYSNVISAFNEALAEMKRDGTFDRIYDEYLK